MRHWCERRCRCAGSCRAPQRQHERNRQQRRERRREHCAGPAGRADDDLHERREYGLPNGAAGVDQPGSERALLRRQALGGDSDQDRKAAGRCARGGQHAHRQQQTKAGRGERRQHATECEHDRAGDNDLDCAVLVGNRTEDRLRRAEYELSDGEREAHRDNGDAGRLRDRDQEQAGSLARSHGDQQDRTGRDHERPQLSLSRMCGRVVHCVGRASARLPLSG